MYSSKDPANNSAYPTQWALNPTAYQDIDSNSVDWAALAQQWIAMKDAAAVLAVPPPAPPAPPAKPDNEEGEAPMEVENIENESSISGDWNSNSNSWNSGWNQWGECVLHFLLLQQNSMETEILQFKSIWPISVNPLHLLLPLLLI